MAAEENIDLEEAREAEARLTVGGRVEYTGNGMRGELVAVGVGVDLRGPIFSYVHFDGRDAENLVKTKYLAPSDAPPPVPSEPIGALDALESSLRPEDLTTSQDMPALARAQVVATIEQARAVHGLAEAIRSLANHLGAK